MTVELISVGTEILLGNIVNTNAAYLAEKIALLGLSCYHQSVVGDNEERLEDAIRLALSRSDIVILSGGLGPTKDDLTKEVTAKVFGRELYEDAHSKERIQAYFDKRGPRAGRLRPTTGSRPSSRREPSWWTTTTAQPRASSWRIRKRERRPSFCRDLRVRSNPCLRGISPPI